MINAFWDGGWINSFVHAAGSRLVGRRLFVQSAKQLVELLAEDATLLIDALFFATFRVGSSGAPAGYGGHRNRRRSGSLTSRLRMKTSHLINEILDRLAKGPESFTVGYA